MRPLRELDPASIRDLAGVVFDVDDTLTTHGRLHPEAFEALWALHRAGIALAAVTGRPLGWADVMAMTWPIDVAVGENGAGWCMRRGGALAHGWFDDQGTRARHAAVLARVEAAVREAMPEVRVASDQPGRRCDLAFDVGEAERLGAAEIARLVSIIDESGARALVSSVHAHVIAGSWDKARGAARAVEDALGAPLERGRWIFVGDSGNDAEAFAWFERTVGVANVREHLSRLPVPPRFVTEQERGAGFAELAAHVLSARGRG
ncbi:MAG: HAD-IIB family hydrolase [Sandaracinaceae bacterium]|nr:HAD-IIB family hydrolase [Sandaracinaceae bacterium]